MKRFFLVLLLITATAAVAYYFLPGRLKAHLLALTDRTGAELSNFSRQARTNLNSLLDESQGKLPQAMFRSDLTRSGTHGLGALSSPAKLKWQFPAGSEISSTPAVADDAVYFGTRNGFVWAVSTVTGKMIWRFKTGKDIQSSPVVFNGTVYIGSYDHYFYALDARKGKLKWRFPTKGRIASSAAIFEDEVYFGSGDGKLYVLGAATGDARRVFAAGNAIDSSPAVTKNAVYFGSDDTYMYAIDRLTHSILWRVKTGNVVVRLRHFGMIPFTSVAGTTLSTQSMRAQVRQGGKSRQAARSRRLPPWPRAWCSSAATTATFTPWMPTTGT